MFVLLKAPNTTGAFLFYEISKINGQKNPERFGKRSYFFKSFEAFKTACFNPSL